MFWTAVVGVLAVGCNLLIFRTGWQQGRERGHAEGELAAWRDIAKWSRAFYEHHGNKKQLPPKIN